MSTVTPTPHHPPVTQQRFAALVRRAVRPLRRKGWWHWIRFALLLAAGSYLGHILSESPRFADIRYSLYQRQVRMEHRGQVYPQHTVLLLLDDEDYWSEDFQARSPYKRNQLAALVDKLNEAGANTVAIDVDWSSPFPDKPDYDFSDYRAEDSLFFAAVKRMCDASRHVVLTTGVLGSEKAHYHPIPTIYASLLPGLPCVSVGHDGFAADKRKIPGMVRLESGGYMDSFSLAIVKIQDPIAYQNLVKAEDKGFRFGRYLTPEDFNPKAGRRFVFNGKAIRDMPVSALRQAVADRVVILGGSYSPFSYGGGDPVDMHNSPGGLEPGVMMHANYVEAELNQDSTFTPISDLTAEVLEWAMALLLALVAAIEVPAGWKWGSVTVFLIFSLLLTYVLMQNLGLFLDFLIPVLMIVIHTFTEEILEMRRELRHARRFLKEHHQ